MTTCLVLHTDYHILWEFSFPQLSTLQSMLLRVFPWEWKKKKTKNKNKNKKKKNQTLNLWIDLENFKILFLRNSSELGFICALSRHVHLMFLSICLKCCCLKRKLRIVFYPRLILFPIILYFYFDGWQQLKHWAYKVSYDKTKNLSLTSVILKGRNLSLVNLFWRYQWYLARVCYYNAPNRKFAEVFCYIKKNCYGEELLHSKPLQS